MIGLALVAIGVAIGLDLLVGEPPTRAHPVAWLGRLIGALDREWPTSERGTVLIGIAIAVCVPLLPAVVAAGAVLAGSMVHPIVGAVVAGLVLFVSLSVRSLLDLTEAVVVATEQNVETAREQVRGLVGRDATTLSPAEIRSGAVESAGENLADGLVATLLPFAVLAPISLPAAAGVGAWVKAVNTLDSMLGYPEKPIGTGSARLDDMVMWIPARLTALAIAIAAADLKSLFRAREWAQAPPSPNSGWPMATLACALSVRLTKPGVYDLNPDRALPTVADGTRAVRLVGRAAAVAVVLAVLATVVIGGVDSLLSTRRASP